MKRFRGLGIDAQDVILGIYRASVENMRVSSSGWSREGAAALDRLLDKGLVAVVRKRVTLTGTGRSMVVALAVARAS